MQRKRSKKIFSKFLSSILCMTLIVAIALFTNGCGADAKDTSDTGAVVSEEKDAGSVVYGEESEELTQFTLIVVDKDGVETEIIVHTDKETVGEALLEQGLIDGDESEYGLYVKTVNGITADYDKAGVYWAFYINGEYAQTGVDSTPVTEGESYSFKIE